MALQTIEIREKGEVIASISIDKTWFKDWVLPAVVVDPRGIWIAVKQNELMDLHYQVVPGYFLSGSEVTS